MFFEVVPGVLGRSANFNITRRFLLTLSVFPDYPFLVTMSKPRETFVNIAAYGLYFRLNTS